MSILSRVFGFSNTSLIQNTQYLAIDPTLLYVTGYDTLTR